MFCSLKEWPNNWSGNSSRAHMAGLATTFPVICTWSTLITCARLLYMHKMPMWPQINEDGRKIHEFRQHVAGGACMQQRATTQLVASLPTFQLHVSLPLLATVGWWREAFLAMRDIQDSAEIPWEYGCPRNGLWYMHTYIKRFSLQ